MDFEQSKLHDHPLIRQAFTYAEENAMSPDLVKLYKDTRKELLDEWFEEKKTEAEYRDFATPEQKDEYLRQVKEVYELNVAESARAAYARKTLQAQFISNSLAPALLMQQAATESSPQLIAMVLLRESLRSGRDLKKLEETFSPEISAPLEEIQHMANYNYLNPGLLGAAAPEVKKVFCALETCRLAKDAKNYTALQKDGAAVYHFTKNMEQQLYNNLLAMAGVDTGLDNQYIKVFNRLAVVLHSEWRIDNTGGEGPKLVPYVPPASNNNDQKRLPGPGRINRAKANDKNDGPIW